MRFVRLSLGLCVAVAVVGVPAAYCCYQKTTRRHFHVVEDGRLYRSGQLPEDVLGQVVREYGIHTVVCLRSLAREGDARPDDTEERWCAGHGVRFLRLEPAAWDSPAGRANLDAFLSVCDAGAGPVLVHCFAGLHRTGVYCAVFRMERHGWSNAEAIAEMYAAGYFQDDPVALEFLKNYTPQKTNRPRP